MPHDKGIVSIPEVFHESYMPEAVTHRDGQIQDLAWCLAPLLKGNGSMNAWLHGPAGSGKTATLRFVLESLQEKASIPVAQVSCWDRFTFHGVVDKVLAEFRIVGATGRSTTFKLQQLERLIKGKHLIVVMDDIDRMPPLERNDAIYNLVACNASLICTASSNKPLLMLDDRVRSRFHPTIIEYPAYSIPALVDILTGRCESGLTQGSHSQAEIHYVAQRAGGDARTAIQTIRHAARAAEKQPSERIEIQHIEKALSAVRDVQQLRLVAALTDHHRLLLKLVKARGEIASGDLWRLYIETCGQRQERPIAARTFNDYVNALIRRGLITEEWSSTPGKRRLLRPVLRQSQD